jgi:hypothetical protein
MPLPPIRTVISAGVLATCDRVWACGMNFSHTISELNLSALIGAFVVAIGFVAILTVILWLGTRLFSKKVPRIAMAFVPAVLVSIVLAFLGSYGLSEFESVYASFGADLPVHTHALLSLRYVLLLPLLSIGSKVALKSVRAVDGAFYSRFLVAEAIFLALVLWSMYAPIFKMC